METAQFLAEGTKACWSEMGTGKTWASLKADELTGARRTLIIHPLIARGMWVEELNRYYGEEQDIDVVEKGSHRFRKARFTLLTVSLLAKLQPLLMKEKFDNIIVDEAHNFKSPKSKRAKALYGARVASRGVVSRADRVWPLTGTPMPNNPAELWTCLKSLAPELITNESNRRMSYAEFTVRYCMTRDTPFGVKILGGKDLPSLQDRIKKFYIRHRLKDVMPDLPPVTLQMYPVNLSPKEKRELKESVRELDLAPDVEDWDLEAQATVQALVGALKIPTVADYADAILDGSESNLVIFGMNQLLLRGVAERLEKYGVSLVYGPTSDKQAEVTKFKEGKTRVLIANITVASTAINLQNCSRVLFGQQSWTPGDNAQAIRRCSRWGQKEHVHVDFVHMSGTIDENMERALSMKTSMILETLGEDSML